MAGDPRLFFQRVGRSVLLHIATTKPRMIFQSPAHGVEDLANDDIDILVGGIVLERLVGFARSGDPFVQRLVIDDDEAAGNGHFHPHRERATEPAMSVRSDDHHVTVFDGVEISPELLRFRVHAGRHRRRRGEVAEGRLHRDESGHFERS